MINSRAKWKGRQFHYQPEKSHVHPFLVDLWNAVREQTDGLVDIEVLADNGGTKLAHLEVVDQLIDGQIQFYALMGSILGPLVPAMNIQSLPFIFRSSEDVYASMDGALGDFLRNELRSKGIYLFPSGLMENGFRHIVTNNRPIFNAEDLEGLTIRIPEGEVFEDTFKAFGARPVQLFVLELYESLKNGSLEAQENPLAIIESLKLYEVTKYISKTSHMWSGFNIIGSLSFWESMPLEIQEIILKNVKTYVDKQREYTINLNHNLSEMLREKGMIINEADTSTFRQHLGGSFYQKWKNEVGDHAWSLLEERVGKLC
ncbi:TRAP transporter substrate-binding protein [Polynucleobacter sinensis]|uniref:TRAP transporter substrate-binding protein n=1 Tax=Polynucleobacter sinensis TaxID=1743157 RepID=UPI0007826F94|nr:TRAP transporter substrate-binding protein [Polynucleobacter sinensis]